MRKLNRTAEIKLRAFDAEFALAQAQETIRDLRKDKVKLISEKARLRTDALLVGELMTNVVDALCDLAFAEFHTPGTADYISKVINEAFRLREEDA